MEEQDKITTDAPQVAYSREELEQHLRARAWKDDAFRQEFLANPKAVLERDYAAWFPAGKIPSELSIKVVEEEEQTLCFVLPPKVPEDIRGMEDLNEDDLSLAAGGVGSTRNRLTRDCPTRFCTPGCITIDWCSEIKKTIMKRL